MHVCVCVYECTVELCARWKRKLYSVVRTHLVTSEMMLYKCNELFEQLFTFSGFSLLNSIVVFALSSVSRRGPWCHSVWSDHLMRIYINFDAHKMTRFNKRRTQPNFPKICDVDHCKSSFHLRESIHLIEPVPATYGRLYSCVCGHIQNETFINFWLSRVQAHTHTRQTQLVSICFMFN